MATLQMGRQPLVFRRLSKLSFAVVDAGQRSPTWTHKEGGELLVAVTREFDVLGLRGGSEPKVLKFIGNAETLETLELDAYLKHPAVLQARLHGSDASAAGAPISILYLSPRLLINYELPGSKIRKIQIKFLIESECSNLVTTLQRFGLPVKIGALPKATPSTQIMPAPSLPALPSSDLSSADFGFSSQLYPDSTDSHFHHTRSSDREPTQFSAVEQSPHPNRGIIGSGYPASDGMRSSTAFMSEDIPRYSGQHMEVKHNPIQLYSGATPTSGSLPPNIPGQGSSETYHSQGTAVMSSDQTIPAAVDSTGEPSKETPEAQGRTRDSPVLRSSARFAQKKSTPARPRAPKKKPAAAVKTAEPGPLEDRQPAPKKKSQKRKATPEPTLAPVPKNAEEPTPPSPEALREAAPPKCHVETRSSKRAKASKTKSAPAVAKPLASPDPPAADNSGPDPPTSPEPQADDQDGGHATPVPKPIQDVALSRCSPSIPRDVADFQEFAKLLLLTQNQFARELAREAMEAQYRLTRELLERRERVVEVSRGLGD